MDISCLMVCAQHVEVSRIKRKNRDFKKARPYEGVTSIGKFEIQAKPKVKKRVSDKVLPNLPKDSKDRVCNPWSQMGRNGNSPSEKPTCTKCGNKHRGECLVGTYNCFECGKSGHKVRECPVLKDRGRESNKFQESSPTFDPPLKNRFYAVRFRDD
nr:uncharacterized protein LOC104646542 [Solanum lycopersicum]